MAPWKFQLKLHVKVSKHLFLVMLHKKKACPDYTDESVHHSSQKYITTKYKIWQRKRRQTFSQLKYSLHGFRVISSFIHKFFPVGIYLDTALTFVLNLPSPGESLEKVLKWRRRRLLQVIAVGWALWRPTLEREWRLSKEGEEWQERSHCWTLTQPTNTVRCCTENISINKSFCKLIY